MARHVETITITLKVRWWVKPLVGCIKALAFCRVPLDPAKCARVVGRGLVPQVR